MGKKENPAVPPLNSSYECPWKRDGFTVDALRHFVDWTCYGGPAEKMESGDVFRALKEIRVYIGLEEEE